MEEEKKEIEENEVVKTPDEEYLKLKRSNSKKTAIIIVLVFTMILMLALVLLYYFNNKDKGSGEGEGNNGTPTVTATPETTEDVMSNDEALKLAQEVHKKAIEFFKNEREKNYDYDYENQKCINCPEKLDHCHYSYYYYDTKDKLEEKFYNIYSNNMSLTNVFAYHTLNNCDPNGTGEKDVTITTNVKDDAVMLPSYTIKDNKAYVDYTCRASGVTTSMSNYKIVKIEKETIEASYMIYIDDEGYTNEETGSLTLIKENGDWRIASAVVTDNCGNIYSVGK